MIDAANYNEQETLKDGAVVTVRAVRPDDKQAIAGAFEKLDPQSIFTRFMHHKRNLSATDLEEATEVDFDEVVALVVTVAAEEEENIIGGCRYVSFESAPRTSATMASLPSRAARM